MKLQNLAVAALMTVGSLGGVTAANAATDLVNPDLCVASVAELDVNGDGFVDATEYPGVDEVETNVDVNGDGFISAAEHTVVCEEGAIDALEQSRS